MDEDTTESGQIEEIEERTTVDPEEIDYQEYIYWMDEAEKGNSIPCEVLEVEVRDHTRFTYPLLVTYELPWNEVESASYTLPDGSGESGLEELADAISISPYEYDELEGETIDGVWNPKLKQVEFTATDAEAAQYHDQTQTDSEWSRVSTDIGEDSEDEDDDRDGWKSLLWFAITIGLVFSADLNVSGFVSGFSIPSIDPLLAFIVGVGLLSIVLLFVFLWFLLSILRD